MAKKITYADDARRTILRGVNKLADAKKVVITKDDTTVVTDSDVKARRETISGRVKQLRNQVEEPTRQIVANAGEEGSVIVKELQEANGNTGYNAATGKTEDLVKAGVIDPAKVTKTALLNAASIAGLMLTTEALVSEIKEKEGGNGGGGMGGMGEGMGGMY